MTNPPTAPIEYTRVTHADTFIGKHVIVGGGSVILSGVALEEGAAVGVLSLINKNCETFSVYAGPPGRKVNERRRNLLELEKRLKASKAR